MRKDMAQLLVETPRRHAGEMFRVHRRRANRDPELALTKQGMRRPYVERKEFGEYFAPVVGYLRKSCGRPWDKVYSELNASLSGGGTVIDHVKVHVLRDFVTLQPLWHNGQACYPYHSYTGANRDKPTPITRRHNDGFYVDRSGILRQAPARSNKRRKRKPQHLIIDDQTMYHKIDGAWFRVWLKPLETAGPGCVPVYDVVVKKWLRCNGRTSYWQPQEVIWTWSVDRELEYLHGPGRYAWRKEQISKRTIRREKLNEILRAG